MTKKFWNFFFHFFLFSIIFAKLVTGTPRRGLLTDKEFYEIFGTNRISIEEPHYGIAQVAISHGRIKRSVDDIWRIPVIYNDGNEIILNFKQTDGILANEDTKVWKARGDPHSNNVKYTRDYQGIKKIGEFTMYQDYDNKAAVILFHKDNIIEGFIGYQKFIQINSQLMENDKNQSIHKYVLINKHPKVSARGLSVSLSDPKELRPDGPPKIVYPELLIIADMDYMNNKALRKILVYWNAVDMLYSSIQRPEIKLNIAGIVLPLDDYTTPWFNKTNSEEKKKILAKLGQHFARYRKEFPDDHYDFVLSFVADVIWISDVTHITGIATVSAHCAIREQRAALLVHNLATYVTAAHELGHLLSAKHDQNTRCIHSNKIMAKNRVPMSENFLWSTCSLKSFSNYFSNKKSMCLDNYPTTMQNSINTTVDDLPDRIYPLFPIKLCNMMKYRYVFGKTECNGYLRCGDPERGIPIKDTIVIPEGTVCGWDKNSLEPTKICYKQKCVPYKRFSEKC